MPQTDLNSSNHAESPLCVDSADLTQLHKALTRLTSLQLEEGTTLEALAFQCEELSMVTSACKQAEAEFDAIKLTLPDPLADGLSFTEQGFKALGCVVTLIDKLPKDLWCYRDDIYDNEQLDYIIVAMSEKIAFLKPLQNKLAHFIDVSQLPDTQSLLENQKIIESAGLFRWFSPRWRRAKRATMALSLHHKLKLEDMLSLFPAMLTYVNTYNELDEINSECAILGDTYQGVDTPLKRIKTIRAWYKDIRFEADYGFSGNEDIGTALFTLDPILAESIQLAYTKHLSRYIEKIDRKITKLKLTYRGYQPLMHPNKNITDSVCQLEAILWEQYTLLANMASDHRLSLRELNHAVKAGKDAEADSLKTAIP